MSKKNKSSQSGKKTVSKAQRSRNAAEAHKDDPDFTKILIGVFGVAAIFIIIWLLR